LPNSRQSDGRARFGSIEIRRSRRLPRASHPGGSRCTEEAASHVPLPDLRFRKGSSPSARPGSRSSGRSSGASGPLTHLIRPAMRLEPRSCTTGNASPRNGNPDRTAGGSRALWDRSPRPRTVDRRHAWNGPGASVSRPHPPSPKKRSQRSKLVSSRRLSPSSYRGPISSRAFRAAVACTGSNRGFSASAPSSSFRPPSTSPAARSIIPA
jgi:hypothetical protein